MAQCLVEDGFLDKIPSVQFSLTTPEGQQEFRVWSNDFNRYICASTVLEKPETADNKTVDTLQAITGYPTETEAKSYVCGSGLQVCYAKCTGATSLSQ